MSTYFSLFAQKEIEDYPSMDKNHENLIGDSLNLMAGFSMGITKKDARLRPMRYIDYDFYLGPVNITDTLQNVVRNLCEYPPAQCFVSGRNEYTDYIIGLKIFCWYDERALNPVILNQMKKRFFFHIVQWEQDTTGWEVSLPKNLWPSHEPKNMKSKREQGYCYLAVGELPEFSSEIIFLPDLTFHESMLDMWLPPTLADYNGYKLSLLSKTKELMDYLDKNYGICFTKTRRKVKFMKIVFHHWGEDY